MNALGRVLRGVVSPRRVLLRMADAVNARLGRRMLGRLYFEDIYRERDPWNYEASPYELGKYAKTLEMLPLPRFGRAFEAGCSIGVFTAMLAARAGEVVALDISSRACRRARARCRDLANVRVVRSDLVRFEDPAGFDLVVSAEMLYYLWERPPDREGAVLRLGALLRPGGWLVLVFGGATVGQDWEAEFERRAGLSRHTTRFFDDPVRPWRLSVLRKPGGA